MRIRGSIGDWPVDLSLELDEEEWQRLGAALRHAPVAPVAAPVAPVDNPPVAPSGTDRLWLAARDLLRRAGSCEGPQLLDELAALAGSAGAAKGLLVRLRHSPDVRIEVREGTQVFTWVGE
ncbi:hypothetical protein J2T41_002507 [Pseudomonas citronellolis]|uniref:hypothetical protein n=1 Tax=Pseudomonas citronellolis TaxID=53408 RepID=UPI00209FE800|nr:hypothetical protein [Pseudomonas citronellolis]MCP1642888.1 hypothetical protein [Pseudomonas citronellolis]MCP1665980.1 hypothetical protein [Pseudomonas citronellolis]MCP1696889.1 hypothetical protein [Pseudomonas citronellolis]MCP1703369.1 hypothetical protein [Pseudomonas citronellolis]MCP1797503.1 hypothetical protein [Pseudomonas citronellolis]